MESAGPPKGQFKIASATLNRKGLRGPEKTRKRKTAHWRIKRLGWARCGINGGGGVGQNTEILQIERWQKDHWRASVDKKDKNSGTERRTKRNKKKTEGPRVSHRAVGPCEVEKRSRRMGGAAGTGKHQWGHRTQKLIRRKGGVQSIGDRGYKKRAGGVGGEKGIREIPITRSIWLRAGESRVGVNGRHEVCTFTRKMAAWLEIRSSGGWKIMGQSQKARGQVGCGGREWGGGEGCVGGTPTIKREDQNKNKNCPSGEISPREADMKKLGP